MKPKPRNVAAALLAAALFAPRAQAQSSSNEVYWHIDPSVESCSMILDPSITQAQWHTFVEQAGAIMTFRPLAPASTLGKMNLKLAVEDFRTPVNQRDPAWINTFAHPDADCPLGDAITFPSLRATLGLSNRVDIGGFWTTAPQANYGVAGGEVKYAFLEDSRRSPAAAVRASVSVLTGVPDFNFSIYSLELMSSKRLKLATPFAGIRGTLAVATETTSKVDLKQENVPLVQGYAGLATVIWKIHVAAEYDIAVVNTFSLSLGFGI